MSKSKINWTERTWNPVTGCTKYSAGCQHCYAETMAKRLRGMGQEKYRNGFKLTLHPEVLDEPIKVKEPSMFFVCSMADLFHYEVPFDFIDKVMDMIKSTPQHTYQLLTKRTCRMFEYFAVHRNSDIPQNAWLGTTVENISSVKRIDYLKEKKASVRFLSCEPLLSDLGKLDLYDIDWVIVGGESGPNARPMHAEWIYNILHQCNEQKVPFFFKQWGEWMDGSCSYKNPERIMLLNGDLIDFTKEAIDEYIKYFHLTGSDYQRLKPRVVSKVGKKKAGCLIDGEQHKEYPRGFYGA